MVNQWLNEQRQHNKKCCLILDSMAEPNPIKLLFKQPLTQIHNITCLYKNTELDNLTEISPWLFLFDETQYNLIKQFIENPENNWGYIVSMDNNYTLADLIQNWQDRMIIEEEPRALYRFQDNRIIIRHLSQLNEQQVPLLLGPISQVIAWNDESKQWQYFINNDPKPRPNPINRPWLSIADPEPIDKELRQKNAMTWLLNNYSQSIYTSDIYPLYEWVAESLTQTDQWQWTTKEQQHHYLLQRLDKEQRESPHWQPLPNEEPQQHFKRCKQLFNKNFECNELTIDISKL